MAFLRAGWGMSPMFCYLCLPGHSGARRTSGMMLCLHPVTFPEGAFRLGSRGSPLWTGPGRPGAPPECLGPRCGWPVQESTLIESAGGAAATCTPAHLLRKPGPSPLSLHTGVSPGTVPRHASSAGSTGVSLQGVLSESLCRAGPCLLAMRGEARLALAPSLLRTVPSSVPVGAVLFLHPVRPEVWPLAGRWVLFFHRNFKLFMF